MSHSGKLIKPKEGAVGTSGCIVHHSGKSEAQVATWTPDWSPKWYIYAQWNTTQPKKNEIVTFAATWLDFGIIILSKVSQTEKDKYHMISLICGIYLVINYNGKESEKE